MKLQDKVAYVTGGGRGIGRAVCQKLASEGAWIVVNDLDADHANAVVSEITEMGGRAVAVAGSVTQPDFADAFITAGLDAFGGVDIIVNNAGYTWDSLVHKMSDAQFDAMLDVHLKAPFCILRAASRFILPTVQAETQAGVVNYRKVVNVSSIAGTGGNAGQANYAAAKAGVIGLTKTLAKEWGRQNVNVNCVAFGMIDTRLTQATEDKKTIEVDGNEISLGIPSKVHAGFQAMIPMQRAGTIEEAAGGIYLMCAPESNYITGQTLTVGGGLVV